MEAVRHRIFSWLGSVEKNPIDDMNQLLECVQFAFYILDGTHNVENPSLSLTGAHNKLIQSVVC